MAGIVKKTLFPPPAAWLQASRQAFLKAVLTAFEYLDSIAADDFIYRTLCLSSPLPFQSAEQHGNRVATHP
jgi:hypothetical protein